MSPVLIKAAQFLLSLSFLIILHELGHFVPAKIFKTRVEKFFLFFDVKFALFKKKIGETVYGLGWLPLGGYVKISGMIDESMDKEQMAQPPKPWEFRSKPAWQRLIIMIGGVTVNIVLGFLIHMMVVMVWGTNYAKGDDIKYGFGVSKTLEKYGFQQGDQIISVNGSPLENDVDISKYLFLRDVSTVSVEHPNGTKETITLPEDIGKELFQSEQPMGLAFRFPFRIDSVTQDSPAEKIGLQKGDRISEINEYPIQYQTDLTYALINKVNDDRKAILTYVRDGVQQRQEIVLDEDRKLGIQMTNTDDDAINIRHRDYSFAESISKGIELGYWQLKDYIAQFSYLFTKKGASQIGGFATIGNLFTPKCNWQSFWQNTAFLSIILAFMNILPIPALDGGHVMFLLYEMITGRKPNDKFMEYAQLTGFFILIALLLYANGNDIYRYLFNG